MRKLFKNTGKRKRKLNRKKEVIRETQEKKRKADDAPERKEVPDSAARAYAIYQLKDQLHYLSASEMKPKSAKR